LQKLALLKTLEDKSNKQQNQAGHSFHWQPNQNFSTDLIFRSQQIWGDKKPVSVQLWIGVHLVLSCPFRRTAGLNYSSSSTTVALENCHLPTTWQEPELVSRNNGLLHHIVITTAGLRS